MVSTNPGSLVWRWRYPLSVPPAPPPGPYGPLTQLPEDSIDMSALAQRSEITGAVEGPHIRAWSTPRGLWTFRSEAGTRDSSRAEAVFTSDPDTVRLKLLSRLKIIAHKGDQSFGRFVATFAKLRKAAVSVVVPDGSHGTSGLPLDGFSWNLMLEWFFLKKLTREFNFS